MYDMIIISNKEGKIDEFKVREWLNSFEGIIINFKTNRFGDCIFIYMTPMNSNTSEIKENLHTKGEEEVEYFGGPIG